MNEKKRTRKIKNKYMKERKLTFRSPCSCPYDQIEYLKRKKLKKLIKEQKKKIRKI